MNIVKFGTIILLLSILVIAFAQADQAPSQDPIPTVENTDQLVDVEACYMQNNSFEVGESITYKLYYNWNFVWISAGEVTFSVNETVEGEYHLKAVGKTYKSYDWFFKVRDYYDCYVDKNSLLPSISTRNVSEGKYKLYDKVIFDQDNHIATSLRGRSEDKTVTREFDVKECMHDILSVVYYTRNLDFDSFESGQEFPVKIFMDKEVWPLNVKYKGKEQDVKVKGSGRYNTYKFSPELISGDVFSEGTEMNVWVSDDNNRIPLLIESPVSVGSVKAVLKSHEGLKYDLSSKLK